MINYNSSAALRSFLDQEGLGMQKKFGQNFLINPQIRKALIDALGAENGDEVWEIGPGLGAMTAMLLERGLKVKAFEIDSGFIRVLKNLFSGKKDFELIEGDALKTCASHTPAPFLMGNLPYNIAAALLADFIERGQIFSRIVVTVQKEVALRMLAGAGSKDYSSFSVLCASVYKVKPLMLIRPSSFYPQPNVDSMGVLLENKRIYYNDKSEYPAVFYPLVRALFSSRRKTLKNNLLTYLSARTAKAVCAGNTNSPEAVKNSAGNANRMFDVGGSAKEMCASILHENLLDGNERSENLELNVFVSLAKSIENMRI